MPSTYAHYKFGCDVLKKLPDAEHEIVKTDRNLFFMGLHGPDLFFFYRPYVSNRVNGLGFWMHKTPGIKFFSHAGRMLKNGLIGDRQLSYIYGFICHFVLDRECHGYINDRVSSDIAGHLEIESEFDRDMLLNDGFCPVSKVITDHIHPSREAAGRINCLFPSVTKDELFESMNSIVFYNRLLRAPGIPKRMIIKGVLKAVGHEEVGKMMINRNPVHSCDESTKTLYKLYDRALYDAVRLISDYRDSAYGRKNYDILYNQTFASE